MIHKKAQFELDPTVILISVVLASIFTAMVWLIPTWDNFSFRYKLILSIAFYPIAFIVTSIMMNK